MYPIDARIKDKGGRLRLLYEVNPMSFLIEQAGGAASTGHCPSTTPSCWEGSRLILGTFAGRWRSGEHGWGTGRFVVHKGPVFLPGARLLPSLSSNCQSPMHDLKSGFTLLPQPVPSPSFTLL